MSKQKPGRASTPVIVSRKGAGKALRGAHRKARYKLHFETAKVNQRRRMRRHLRAHPADAKTRKMYEFVKHFGHPDDLGLCARGRKRLARAQP